MGRVTAVFIDWLSVSIPGSQSESVGFVLGTFLTLAALRHSFALKHSRWLCGG